MNVNPVRAQSTSSAGGPATHATPADGFAALLAPTPVDAPTPVNPEARPAPGEQDVAASPDGGAAGLTAPPAPVTTPASPPVIVLADARARDAALAALSARQLTASRGTAPTGAVAGETPAVSPGGTLSDAALDAPPTPAVIAETVVASAQPTPATVTVAPGTARPAPSAEITPTLTGSGEAADLTGSPDAAAAEHPGNTPGVADELSVTAPDVSADDVDPAAGRPALTSDGTTARATTIAPRNRPDSTTGPVPDGPEVPAVNLAPGAARDAVAEPAAPVTSAQPPTHLPMGTPAIPAAREPAAAPLAGGAADLEVVETGQAPAPVVASAAATDAPPAPTPQSNGVTAPVAPAAPGAATSTTAVPAPAANAGPRRDRPDDVGRSVARQHPRAR